MHCLQRRGVGELFNEYGIARIQQHVEDFVQRICIAAGQEDVVIIESRLVHFLHKFEKELVYMSICGEKVRAYSKRANRLPSHTAEGWRGL